MEAFNKLVILFIKIHSDNHYTLDGMLDTTRFYEFESSLQSTNNAGVRIFGQFGCDKVYIRYLLGTGKGRLSSLRRQQTKIKRHFAS
jgi:hypothetical protein